MSNFTDFFPIPAAGSAEITNPNELPIIASYTSSTTNLPGLMYTKRSDTLTGGSVLYIDSTSHHLTGSSSFFNGYTAQSILTAGTEATLLNITSGSGYLCNVFLPPSDIGATNRTQKITIIVDGTTYTYEYDFSTYSTSYMTLLWGFSGHGDFSAENKTTDTSATGLFGHGGMMAQSDKSLPPFAIAISSISSTLRTFSAHDFFRFNLPRLRFESSLQVKVLNESMYTTSGTLATSGASYYLDTEIANM